MDLDNFRIQLGEKLTEIRETNTGLNQEQFYFKYLDAVAGKKIKAGTSAQGFMKQLENGTINCPAQFLPIYSEIARITVNDLLSFSDEHIPDVEALTYKSVIRMLNELIAKETLELENGDTDPCAVLRINDPIIRSMLETYRELKTLSASGKISTPVYNMWEKGFLSTFNDRLLDFSFFNTNEREEYTKALIDNRRDFVKAYQTIIKKKRTEGG